MIDGKWLEDFLCVARTGSFSRAATERHITQSAFSRRIKALEQWVGSALVDRSSYPTRLTPGGERFREVVEHVLGSLKEVRRELRAAAAVPGKKLRVSAQHSLASGFLVQWLAGVREQLGGVALEVRADNFHDCLRDLDEGNVDLLICYVHEELPMSLDPGRFVGVRIADTSLVPVSRPGTGGRPVFSLRAPSTASLPMLHYGGDSYLGRAAMLLIERRRLTARLTVVYECASSESLRAAAVSGLGMAWLPAHFVADDLAKGLLVHAGRPSHELALGVDLYADRARLGNRQGSEALLMQFLHTSSPNQHWTRVAVAP